MRPQAWKDEARLNPGSWSPEQLERMEKGRPPVGDDGFPMEIHHRTPLSQGGKNVRDNFMFLTRTEHRLGNNFRKNHPKCPVCGR